MGRGLRGALASLGNIGTARDAEHGRSHGRKRDEIATIEMIFLVHLDWVFLGPIARRRSGVLYSGVN